MFENFLTVGNQVLILFILISIGFISNKFKILKKETIPGLTDFVLYVVSPCVIIHSFLREFDSKMLIGIGITALAATGTMFFNILVAKLLIRDKDDAKNRVLRFGAIFSNCGYMSLPLQQALLGDDGVFYGAVFIGVFNILSWSYGVALMSSEKGSVNPKKMFLNPGVLSVLVGILLFSFSVSLPTTITAPIGYLAALNTPIPMVIIGYQLANANLLKIITNKSLYLTILIRLIIVPAITLVVLHLLQVDKTIAITVTVAASAPTAAMTTMFAIKFKRDTELSVSLVSLSTILSLITMPILVGLSQSL